MGTEELRPATKASRRSEIVWLGRVVAFISVFLVVMGVIFFRMEKRIESEGKPAVARVVSEKHTGRRYGHEYKVEFPSGEVDGEVDVWLDHRFQVGDTMEVLYVPGTKLIRVPSHEVDGGNKSWLFFFVGAIGCFLGIYLSVAPDKVLEQFTKLRKKKQEAKRSRKIN